MTAPRPSPAAYPSGLLPPTPAKAKARAKGEFAGMDETVPLGIPAPRVAVTLVPRDAVTVAVVVEVCTTVVVNTVVVTIVWPGLLITRELVPPRKLKIVPTDWTTVL